MPKYQHSTFHFDSWAVAVKPLPVAYINYSKWKLSCQQDTSVAVVKLILYWCIDNMLNTINKWYIDLVIRMRDY